MAEHIDLLRPPVTEALIDLRTPVREGFSTEMLKPVRDALVARFPNVEEHNAMEARIEMRDGKPVAESRAVGFHGLVFKAGDGLDVAQFRRDGFTVNRLAPYTGWQPLVELAVDLLPLYVRHADPKRFNRVAIRFINRLVLPVAPGQPLSDYLTAPPQLPQHVVCRLDSFVTRVSLADAVSDLRAHVSQSMDNPAADTGVTILLDIDVFREVAPDVEVSEAMLRDLLKKMRILKNAIFFGSITERAADLYRR